MFRHFFDFTKRRPVLKIVSNAAVASRVGIITAPFIEVVGQIVVLGVPHSKFIVDQHHFSIVGQVCQYIALNDVVMRQADLVAWDQIAKFIFISVL